MPPVLPPQQVKAPYHRILETLTVMPSMSAAFPASTKALQLPTRSTAAFGGPLDARSTIAPLGRYGVSQSVVQGTVLDGTVSIGVVPVCGPSPRTHSMLCYNALSGEQLDEFPVPGAISTTPVYVDGSWFFGTSKGFFIRTDGTSLRSTPLLGGAQQAFWGGLSRQTMRSLRPRTGIDGPEAKDAPLAKFRASPRPGWKWFYTASAEFVGTPVPQGNMIYTTTANQFLYGFDLASGRLVWTSRLAPESPLRLSGSPVAASNKEVLIGTDEGTVTALDPANGSLLWRYQIPLKVEDRFRAVVAPPFFQGRSFIVSNSESITQRVSLDGRTVEWSYPMGSVAQIRTDDASVFVGGSDGAVASLESRSGILRWKMTVSIDSPIASVFFVRKRNQLLVANKRGTLTLLDARTGALLATTRSTGEVVGEFFPGQGESDACLSFAIGGFRCYIAEGTNLNVTAL